MKKGIIYSLFLGFLALAGCSPMRLVTTLASQSICLWAQRLRL